MFTYNDMITATACEPGVSRKVLSYSPDVMMCELHFQKGAVGNTHKHPHTQVTYIEKGSFRFTIGDETREVHKGDSVLMPPDVLHGTVALEEDSMLVDVFTPMRKEFLI